MVFFFFFLKRRDELEAFVNSFLVNRLKSPLLVKRHGYLLVYVAQSAIMTQSLK